MWGHVTKFTIIIVDKCNDNDSITKHTLNLMPEACTHYCFIFVKNNNRVFLYIFVKVTFLITVVFLGFLHFIFDGTSS